MTDGVLIVNKPAGFTSHDVVAKLRGILHQRKIGHTGTLDPDATGVLPVCLGKATKLCSFLTDETKSYEAVVLLGTETDTQDVSGHVTAQRPVCCSEEEIRTATLGFLGPQMQIPPMYSALKKDGKKLYELARAGIEVEREPRPVTFYDIAVTDVELPRFRIRVTCSRGTYIRTLCHDIGQRLGCGACMESLVRTRVGRFSLEDARSLEEISEAAEAGKAEELVIPVDALFRHLPGVMTAEDADAAAHNGNFIPEELVSVTAPGDASGESETLSGTPAAGRAEEARLYDSSGAFVGIFRPDGKRWKPVQMFWTGGIKNREN